MTTIINDIHEKLVFNCANIKTALIDAARTKTPVTFYTVTRNYINTYKCIDTQNKPFTLKNYTISGGLVYYKKNNFEWVNISIDNITKIELMEG